MRLRYTYRNGKVGSMPLSIRLPADIESRLATLAALTGRSKTFYVAEAIREHLADLEDAYLAAAVRDRIASGAEAVVPLADLLNEYGLAD
jgi:RHH-type rel operon transcriptional repressor/antitoxin RelB